MKLSFVRSVIACVLIATLSRAQTKPDTDPFVGHWTGAIDLVVQTLEIDVDLRRDGDAWSGDITIPAQGARDLALESFEIRDKHAKFAIDGIPGEPTFDGELDGEKLHGAFTQNGQEFTFELVRGGGADDARAKLAGFEEFIERARQARKVPGFALAIVVNGEVVLQQGFGLRNVEEQLPVTTKTLFAIGSSTKAFTAFVLGTLVDEGKLEWDAPAIDKAPSLRFFERSTTERITARDLVTHRSGLPRHDLVWYNADASRDELVKRLAYLEPVVDLREEWNYQNLAYVTAGWLSEQITGKSWEDSVRERVFTPLGMAHSNFSVLDSQKRPDYALGYAEKDDVVSVMPFRDITAVGPAGSINSDIEDMTRWVTLQLSKGRVGDKQVIAGLVLKELHTPQMTLAEFPERAELGPQSYAHGWLVEPYRGHLRLHHGGNIDGFSALVSFLPEDGIGLVALTNLNGNGLPEIVMRHALDRLLGLEPIAWDAEALAKRDAAREIAKDAEAKQATVRKTGTQPAHELGDYVGEFAHPGYGTLRVELDGAQLCATFNRIRTPLEHWHYEVFNGSAKKVDDQTFNDVKLLFVTDLRGEVNAVESELEPRVKPIRFERRADARMSDAQFLADFVGEYEFAGQNTRIELSGTALRMNVPGQPTYDLVPQKLDAFTLKQYSAIRVRFVRDAAGKVTEIVSEQPNGVFSGKRK